MISKSSFYEDGQAFIETEPPTQCKEKTICGCTKTVSVKPEGEPRQIKFGLAINLPETTNNVHNIEGRVSVGLSVFFTDSHDLERDLIWFSFGNAGQNHIYCMLYKNKIHFEYYAPGHGKYSNYIFPTIYQGNDIDRSSFFNGHSAPKINTTVPSETQIWTYACSWGKEAMRLLETTSDIDRLFYLGNKCLRILRNVVINKNDSPKEINDIIKNSSFFSTMKDAEKIIRNIDLLNHPIFPDLMSVENATRS